MLNARFSVKDYLVPHRPPTRKRGTVTRNWQQSLMLQMEDAYTPKDDGQMSLFSAAQDASAQS